MAMDDGETSERIPSKEERKKSVNKVIVIETGGPKGLEPTRYGDWEKNGRCIDF
jgi:hypothetical protein